MSMSEEHSITLQPGTVLGGKYEVVKCLGKGSMGLVYACRHRELQGQIVAVKVLFPEVAEDKVSSARFKNEILASYGVSHPNVVRAYEYLTDRDLVAYTMEYVGGGDLAERLSSDERMPIAEIVRLLAQMAAGCQAIHDADIVHRDLKPENILLTKEGNVKIADFGIARNRHGPKLTEHGGVVGTIDYVAPEYMLKSQVDWRSDIYALGILAYEMVTGEPPFRGESVYATMTKRLKTDPEPPSKLRPDCPAELDAIILKAMQRDPENRYQASIEMFYDLQTLAAKLGIAGASGGAAVVPNQLGQSQRKGPVFKFEEEPTQKAAGSVEPKNSGKSGRVNSAVRSAEVMVAGGSEKARRNSMPDDDIADFDISERRVVEDVTSPATEILSASFVDYAVETDMESRPSSGPSRPTLGSAGDVVSESWRSPSGLPTRHGYRDKRHQGRPRQNSGTKAIFGDMLALGIAAAVGIGCGFMFLKLFAPSLLAKLHF
jgi:serine/threonine protein kinase